MKKRVIKATITEKDIDQYKHANYTTHVRLYEEGHHDFMAALNAGFAQLKEHYGVLTFIRYVSIEYFKELLKGDVVTVHTEIGNIGTTSLRFDQSILKNKELISTAQITVVFVNAKTRKKTPIPKELRRKLEEIAAE